MPMNSTIGKIILGNIFRNLLTAVITFFATKHVLQADVAARLNRGDTVSLYGQDIPINMTMIVNVLVALALPILLPIFIGIWSRMIEAYKLVVARSEAFAMSKKELTASADQASVANIIKTVVTQTPA